MRIKFNDIEGTTYGSVKFFDLSDTFGFGKHRGDSIEGIIESDPDYIGWLLDRQPGFGLNDVTREYFLEGEDEANYPDDKLPMTAAELVPVTVQNNREPKKQLKIFQPILGVNIMKRAILVSHDNKYNSSEDHFYDEGGTEYSYLTNLKDLEINDFVVVDCANGLQACRVTKLIGLTPGQTSKAYKWVISKIDLAQHEKNKRAQEKIQEIQNKVSIRKSQVEDLIILKQMAKEDPTMMDLLTELGDLDPSLVPVGLLEAPKDEKKVE